MPSASSRRSGTVPTPTSRAYTGTHRHTHTHTDTQRDNHNRVPERECLYHVRPHQGNVRSPHQAPHVRPSHVRPPQGSDIEQAIVPTSAAAAGEERETRAGHEGTGFIVLRACRAEERSTSAAGRVRGSARREEKRGSEQRQQLKAERLHPPSTRF